MCLKITSTVAQKWTNNFDSTEQFWYILTHTYRIWLVKPYLCNIPCARMTCDASIQIMTNSPICFWSESCSRCNYWGIIQSNSVLLKRTSMGCLLSTNWCRISQLSTVYRTSRYTRGESPLKSHAWLHQEGKNRSNLRGTFFGNTGDNSPYVRVIFYGVYSQNGHFS